MDQRGWTLVETLIVILIILVLSTIAVPIFQGSKAKSHNSVAQTNLSEAFRSAKSSNPDQWPDTTDLVSSLKKDEPSFSYHAYSASKASTSDKDISVSSQDGMITFCNKSKTRLFYCLRYDVTNSMQTMDQDDTVIADNGQNSALSFLTVQQANADDEDDLGIVARSTGNTEASAWNALPTRTSDGTLTGANARGWQKCLGSCAQ